MWSEAARKLAHESNKRNTQSHSVTLTTNEYDLIVLCIYNTINIIRRRIERNADPRDSVGDAKRIWELNKLKSKLFEGKEEE